MDILVTTPKSEIDTSREEGEAVECEGGYWFRTFRFRPKVVPGDKIFFVEDGLIKGYGIIFEVSRLSEAAECDFTGRQWGTQGGYPNKERSRESEKAFMLAPERMPGKIRRQITQRCWGNRLCPKRTLETASKNT